MIFAIVAQNKIINHLDPVIAQIVADNRSTIVYIVRASSINHNNKPLVSEFWSQNKGGVSAFHIEVDDIHKFFNGRILAVK
jgi:hypothetical protein